LLVLGLQWFVLRAALAMLCACGRFGFDPAGDLDVDASAQEDGGIDPVCTTATPTVADVAIGRTHVCIVAAQQLYCWGSNAYGQLGVGDTADRSVPTLVASTEVWADVSARGDHTCGHTANDNVLCWGRNDADQLGLGDATNRDTPTLVGSYVQVAAGDDHTCARTAGRIECWGANGSGQLGVGDRTPRSTPTLVSNQMWMGVQAGGAFTCAQRVVMIAPENFCWGANAHGQAAGGDFVDQLAPRSVGCCDITPNPGTEHVTAVHAGGALMVWGRGDHGQLGQGDTMDRNIGVQFASSMISGTAGAAHSCAIQVNPSALQCWGANQYGQLGLGAQGADEPVPVTVGSDGDWQRVWAGGNTTCALKNDGRFFCWGQNDRGQLGIGHTFARSRPIQVCF
jgi:alpha-tubulin suppressor-like RCC1 family protein